jgi:hypothetical protein
MVVMYGKAIKAFPDQDHESHIAVHTQFLSDPSLGGSPMVKAVQPILIAHIAEHVALLYRSRMQASIGVGLPNLPDLRDPKFKLDDIDPQLDLTISQRAAQIVQQAPVMKKIRGLVPEGQGNNPLQYAQQLAKMEADALKAKTQADIQATQAKAKTSIEIDKAKAKNDMQIAMAKTQADLNSKAKKLQADVQIEREKEIMEAQKDV